MKQTIDKPKTSTTTLTIRRASAVLAIVGFGGGMAVNGMAESEHENYHNATTRDDVVYSKEKIEGHANTRNALYFLGAVELGLFAITFAF